MDGLLITHGGKRYFVRPELLELCQVSEAEVREAEKHKALPPIQLWHCRLTGRNCHWTSCPALSVVSNRSNRPDQP